MKGHEPVTEWAKDTKTFKRLLATMALEDAQQVVTDFLESPPRWYAERNLYEPENILQAANQLLARSRTPAPTLGAPASTLTTGSDSGNTHSGPGSRTR